MLAARHLSPAVPPLPPASTPAPHGVIHPSPTPSATLPAGTPYLSAAKCPSPEARCSSLPFSSLASASIRFAISSNKSLILRRTPRDSGPPNTADGPRAQSGSAAARGPPEPGGSDSSPAPTLPGQGGVGRVSPPHPSPLQDRRSPPPALLCWGTEPGANLLSTTWVTLRSS